MRSSRAATSGVSSSSCFSLVGRKGSDEAMKSTSRPGSSILSAMVCSSSERVGEELTICWNCETTLRCRASISASRGGVISATGSTDAVMNGSNWLNSPSRTRCVPSVKTNRLWLGILTTLWTVASVPTLCRSAGCGASMRASRWATTTTVFSSPSDWIS